MYILMNKDKALAKLEINNRIAYVTDIINELPGYIGDIRSWLDSRTSPITRENVYYALKIAGINTKEKYLDMTYGISLSDTFWVKHEGSNKTWDDVNPYKNRFSRLLSDVILNGVYTGGNIKSPSPDYQLDGSIDKCWKRLNGEIYLYKTDGEKWSGITGNRPYCEYYATQIAKQLIDFPNHFVKYGIEVNRTKNNFSKAYAKCPIFTSEKYGYTPMCSTPYRHTLLKELDHRLEAEDRVKLREMLVLDSIILNFDRHDGNYGFIVDNDTYRPLHLAPIYDNDCSLGPKVSLQGKTNIDEAYREALSYSPKTQCGSYIQQARWAMTDRMRRNMKNMLPFHFKRLPSDIDLDTKRIQFMEYIVNTQIKAILGLV